MIWLCRLAICLFALTSATATAEPPATAAVSKWPSPSTPTFGQASSETICVYVFGEVHRPGAYYLARGSKLGQAVEAAQGVTEFAWWTPTYSALVRQPRAGGMPPRVIPFTKDRKKDEQMPLEDGDQIYFGHESY